MLLEFMLKNYFICAPQLLDVADVLDMAIKSVPVEEATDGKNVHLKNLYEGIVMTEKEILKVCVQFPDP